ncbi:MAG: Asp-tRNA(Asn)/Glu-tRNA(Gln) amidotransferase subunit GatC [Candidatus Colwellbacteria bacterium]|nr:Asp-tRNA(Asn)/Glu-tRNA(Gln) amidotransferase subunit GatC [Candidatus Colwellbacteria bacterium]
MDLKVDYIAKLARIKLDSHEEDKFAEDLGKILEHFKELQSVNTEGIAPMTGGTELKNIFRKDELDIRREVARDNLVNAFPDKEKDYLKVPPIFD